MNIDVIMYAPIRINFSCGRMQNILNDSTLAATVVTGIPGNDLHKFVENVV